MILELPYANGVQTGKTDGLSLLGTLAPTPIPPLDDMDAALQEGLSQPIGLPHPALEHFHPGDAVAIAVSDATRKTGADLFLPLLVHALEVRGIPEQNISFLIAGGVHRPATEEEKQHILGAQLHARFHDRVFNHNAQDDQELAFRGVTQRGTNVWLNRRACNCHRLILTGSVVMHYFAGFGGGRKALVPGLAGAQTIAQNHSLNLHPSEPRLNPAVRIGALDGNPVAEDLLEAARMRTPDLIVNTVMAQGRIAGLFIGELDAAHRTACAFAARAFAVPIPARADLVIAAVQGAPNFIQSHKALFNAFSAAKPEGCVILLAPALEGLGGAGFTRYLNMRHPESVMDALRQQADINGQTALSTLQKAPRTLLVTDMPDEQAQQLGMERARSLAEVMDQARTRLQAQGLATPTCWVMPDAGVTVPIPEDE